MGMPEDKKLIPYRGVVTIPLGLFNTISNGG
jgi:hypothetical protein